MATAATAIVIAFEITAAAFTLVRRISKSKRKKKDYRCYYGYYHSYFYCPTITAIATLTIGATFFGVTAAFATNIAISYAISSNSNSSSSNSCNSCNNSSICIFRCPMCNYILRRHQVYLGLGLFVVRLYP
jgi:hypothetical protein